MVKKTLFFALLCGTCALFAQGNNKNDDNLLSQYILSKGPAIIVFDASNIKQFWIDKTVASKNDSFEIMLTEKLSPPFESLPFKVQLANVNEAQDCKIDVIANTDDLSFSVLNDSKKVLSSSISEDSFINYSIRSSTFHLEDSQKFSFNIAFHSKTAPVLSIKKIILSFSENKKSSFLTSPGVLKISANTVTASSAQVEDKTQNSFSLTGKRSAIFSSKKILTANTPVTSSVTIKNIGTEDANIYVGYAAYTKDRVFLDGKNYPYKGNNKVLTVISISEDKKTIIVDSYSDWYKNCYLALNAKEDMSDIPNTSVTDRVVEIKQLDNGQAEILLEKALNTQLKKGDKVRVHGATNGTYLYTSHLLLHPGEEKSVSSTIQKDDDNLEYSPKALPRGVCYVVPLILSYSSDSNEDNTILINDFSVSF